ncbi:MAG: hypothetical protein GWP61_20700 [Chloroflexi bacterium]|jgi:phenylacetate-CoA ligase|nr:hypothetical protein [Chloroflexota bacterium]
MSRAGFVEQGMRLANVFGYPAANTTSFLRDSQFWSKSELEAYQASVLRNLIEHCYQNVPYYRQVMQERGLTPEYFRTADDLAKLPYLTRTIVREQADRLRATNYPDSECEFRRSGGTTGEPIQVATNVKARAFEVGAYLRGFEWMHYKLGQPMVRLFGGSLGLPQTQSPKVMVREWLFNSHFLPAFELTPENVDDYVDVINCARQPVLVGYVSAVRNLAEYVAVKNLRVNGLKSVICTAEYMPDQWREYIGEVLDAPVFCYYGCGEVNSIAYECSSESGYLVCEEHLVLEVAGNNPTRFVSEGHGQACVTSLFNYAMPLIRYLNGDMIELTRATAGRSHKRISKLEGRVVDQLLSQEGHRVSGALIPHMVFRSGFPAWKYQVLQTEPDEVEFHYLLNGITQASREMKEQLARIFRHHLGSDLKIRFVVGGFEVPASGKHRFVINKISD